MKIAEIRALSTEELKRASAANRDELFRLRMQHYTGQLARPSDISKKRRQVARLETVLAERARSSG